MRTVSPLAFVLVLKRAGFRPEPLKFGAPVSAPKGFVASPRGEFFPYSISRFNRIALYGKFPDRHASASFGQALSSCQNYASKRGILCPAVLLQTDP